MAFFFEALFCRVFSVYQWPIRVVYWFSCSLFPHGRPFSCFRCSLFMFGIFVTWPSCFLHAVLFLRRCSHGDQPYHSDTFYVVWCIVSRLRLTNDNSRMDDTLIHIYGSRRMRTSESCHLTCTFQLLMMFCTVILVFNQSVWFCRSLLCQITGFKNNIIIVLEIHRRRLNDENEDERVFAFKSALFSDSCSIDNQNR